MRKKYRWVIAVVIGIGSLSALASLFLRSSAPLPTASVVVGGRTYVLEVARTETEQRKGLSGREELCGSCGMLFLFGTPGRSGFWMRGMRFPLDIVWLDGERVVFLEHRIPADAPETFTPPVPADRVLELPAGAADRLGAGDRVGFRT